MPTLSTEKININQAKKTQQKFRNRRELRAALLARDITLTDIARATHTFVSQVSAACAVEHCPTRQIRHLRIEQEIARALDLDVLAIFPDHGRALR